MISLKNPIRIAFVIAITNFFCNIQTMGAVNDKIINKLNLFLEMKNDADRYDWVTLPNHLRENDIDPEIFSEEVLSDVIYSSNWYDTITLLCYSKMDEDGYDLLQKLSFYFERSENQYTFEIVKTKLSCINYIEQFVGPNYFKNERIRSFLVDYFDHLYSQGDIINPEYWYKKYDLASLSEKPQIELSDIHKKTLRYTEAIARLCVQFAGKLYIATNDERYLDILKAAEKSNYTQIRNEAIYGMTSESRRTAWYNGSLEIFYLDKKQWSIPADVLEQRKARVEESKRAREKK